MSKYRAWLIDENRYIVVGCIDFTNELAQEANRNSWFGFNNIILEQFTGLHDKNGVEVYENDKVLYTDNFKVNGTTSHISSVEWNDELNGFFIKAVGIGYYSVNKQSIERYSVEVIGNIHSKEN